MRSEGGQRLFGEAELQQATQIALLRSHHGWNPAAIQSWNRGEPAQRAWSESSLGTRIRLARRSRDLTLAEAARRIGISRPFLSSLERGETGVSQQILNSIADTLHMPPSAFAPIRFTDRRLMHANEQPITELDQGVTWHELAAPGHALEPALLVVPPGAGSGGYYGHQGETFVYVLSGSLHFQMLNEESEVNLVQGDSLMLAAGAIWSWSNTGPSEARLLWVEQLAPDAWS
jgi:transcriptional regulator with XRE-family HTH domain